jgi:molybdopterin molybdotransferase
LRRVTVGEALAAMAQFPVRTASIERVLLARLEGRVLAREVTAVEDVPCFDRSMVDGFAVRAAEVGRASPQQPVLLRIDGEVMMGAPPAGALEPGGAFVVPTGGAVPAGTTGVVKIEDTRVEGDRLYVLDGAHSADRITRARSDVTAGDVLFRAGRVLDPAALGLLAAAGVAHANAYVPPRIAVLVTGDELVESGRPLRLGQIRESNGTAVSAALNALGFEPQTGEIVPDDKDAFRQALRHALRTCDGAIISGGSSVGLRDFTPLIVGEAGEPGVVVHGVRARPGRPVLLAMIGDRPVIGLPGNPVSALVMFEALAKPMLLRMFDKTDETLPWRARLAEALEVEPDLEHRIPVRLQRAGQGLEATPLLGTSSQMHILAFADGIVIVPEGTSRVAPGSSIDVWPLTKLRTLR